MPAMATPWKHPENGIYYLRLRVPDDIRESVGKREIKKSLGTRNFAEAKRIFTAEYDRTLSTFEQYRQQVRLTPKDIEILAQRWQDSTIEQIEAEGSYGDYLTTFSDNSYEYDVEDISQAIEGGYREQLRVVEPYLKQVLTNNSLAIPEGSESYRALTEKLCWRLMSLRRIVFKRASGNWEYQGERPLNLLDEKLSVETAPVVRSTSKAPKISVAFENWQKELRLVNKDKGEGVLQRVNKQIKDYTPGVNRFIELFGDLPVDEVTRKHVNEYRLVLFGLPSRPSKKTAKLPLREQVKVAEEQKLPTLVPVTVKNRLHGLSAVLSYAVEKEHIDVNPVLGLKVTGARKGSSKRQDFTTEELKEIFSSRLFTEGWRPFRADFGEAIFWLPLLAYYTGARREELAQLSVADIKERDGVHFIQIQEFDEENRVKTGELREIPIHGDLVTIGFFDYIKSVSKEGGRLFPKLKRTKDGYLGERVQRCYKRNVLDPLGITGRKPMHGFRHTFKTLCREQEIPEETHNAITGHKDSNVAGGYGSKTLKAKAKAMARFPSLPVPLDSLRTRMG